MSWFFFTWNGDKRETWQTYLAEQRQEVCDEAKPQYVTILDCSGLIQQDTFLREY